MKLDNKIPDLSKIKEHTAERTGLLIAETELILWE